MLSNRRGTVETTLTTILFYSPRRVSRNSCCSLDTTKGMFETLCPSDWLIANLLSVMSGIITGPHFKKYFHDPTPIDVGTMVAVLEVGAFGECHFRQ